ncbi:MAG: hypothetical protein J6W65_07785, partial [Oscillospiraceae bacterium]|nr:hypothetical protein [Oscillospiraceae bacterium]
SVDENGKITVETPEYEERWETVDLVEKPKDETVIVGKAKDTDDSDYSEIAGTDKKPAPEPAVKSEPVDTEKTETKPERKTEIDESAKAESFAMAKEKKKANKKQKNKSKNV